MGELIDKIQMDVLADTDGTSNSWVRTGDDVILTADREIFVFDRIKVC